MNTTDTVKAKLTPGEFVIRKEAVDMIGVPMLEKLNGMPEEGGGHSAIDRIIQMATLQNMQPMYSGGEVEPNFSGDMQGMMGGGYMKPQQYQEGGMALRRPEPTQFNPEFVNVDYELKEDPSGSSANIRNLKLFSERQRKYTDEANVYRQALESFNKAQYEGKGQPVQAIEAWATKVDPELGNEGEARDKFLFKRLKEADIKLQQAALTSNREMGQMIYQANRDEPIIGNFDQPLKDYGKASKEFEGLLRKIIRRPIADKALNESLDMPTYDFYEKYGNPFYGEYDSGATGERYESQNPERFLDYRDQPVLDVFENGGLIGMMQGGEVPGYQEGGQPQQNDAQVQAMMEQQAMMQQQPQPNQFVPFDQRPNQNPATGNWGESGDYMQAIRAEKDSLDMQDKEILRQKALNAIQRIRLNSLAGQGIPNDVGAINSDAMGSYSRPDSAGMSSDRNEGQYLQQQVMQRSPESVLQGMFQGDNNRGIYR